jgi:hypothetical protein
VVPKGLRQRRHSDLDGCTVACSLVTFPRNSGGFPGSWVEGGLSVLQIMNRTLLQSVRQRTRRRGREREREKGRERCGDGVRNA